MEYKHQHPQLDELIGIIRGEDVIQFRGIPYATIPGRFRQSILRTTLPQTPFDAKAPGCVCPQTSSMPYPEFWTGPLPANGVHLEQPSSSEFNCLNLNITAHPQVLEDNVRYPVLVYIHGGAFTVGSSSIQVAGREIYDGANLSRSSFALSKPLVIVTINYRVGALGFLCSQELAAYNKAHGEAIGNYGLHDQRQALEWVYRFIDGFGGDPDNITVAGGSAGAASSHYQALFKNRKFKRAILGSGSAIGLGAMDLAFHQRAFDVYSAKFGGTDDPVERLKAVPEVDIVEVIQGTIAIPVIDGEWIAGRGVAALRQVQSPPDLLIGACAYEQDLTYTLFADPATMSPFPDDVILGKLRIILSVLGISRSPERLISDDILSEWSLAGTSRTPGQDVMGWAEFIADLIFRIPPLLVAHYNTKSTVYVFDFQGTNPFRGWKLGYERANHAVTDMFLFDPAGDLVEQKHREAYIGAVSQLHEQWIRFCHGQFSEERTKDSLGPVYTIANNGTGRKCNTLEEAYSETSARRYRKIIKFVINEQDQDQMTR